MNSDCVWAKTLLSVYRYLERIAGAIDKIIEKTGLGSANNFSPKVDDTTSIFITTFSLFLKRLLI